MSFLLLVAVTAVLPVVARQANTFGLAGEFGGPAGLACLGVPIVAAFCLALVEACRRRRLAVPRKGLLAAAALLVAATILSAVLAPNRYAALVGTTEIVLGTMYLATVLMVADGRNAARWLLAALVAGAFASAATSLLDRAQVPPEAMLEYFEQNRLEILRERGIEPGSAEEQMFRVRIAGDFAGTFYHPNLMANCMMVGLLATIALIIGHLRGAESATAPFRPEEQNEAAAAQARLRLVIRQRPYTALGCAILGLCAIVMAIALVMTKGRAAQMAWAAGLYLMLILGLVRSRRARIELLVGPAVLVLALLVLSFEHGWFSGALSSLRHRWEYWQATSGVIAERPWTGVGPSNFAEHYVTHKAATAPEEIRHPHNALLWAWSEIGAGGLVALVALAALGFREAFRRMRPVAEAPVGEAAAWKPMAGTLVLVALLLAVFIGIAPESFSNRSLTGTAADVVAVVLSVIVALLCIAVAFVAVLTIGREDDQSLWNIGRKWIRYGLAGALFAFWLQSMASVSVPYLATTAAMLCLVGILVATGHRGPAAEWSLSTSRRRALVGGAAAAVAVGYVVLVLYPVVGGNWAVADARLWPVGTDERRALLELAADRAPSWDEPHLIQAGDDVAMAEGPMRAADRLHAQAAEAALRHALAELDKAIALSPRNTSALQRAGDVCRRLDERHGATGVRERALGYLERAVELYPTDMDLRVDYMRVLKRAGRRAAAAREAREALRLDDLMPDERQRLAPAVRAECWQVAESAPE